MPNSSLFFFLDHEPIGANLDAPKLELLLFCVAIFILRFEHGIFFICQIEITKRRRGVVFRFRFRFAMLLLYMPRIVAALRAVFIYRRSLDYSCRKIINARHCGLLIQLEKCCSEERAPRESRIQKLVNFSNRDTTCKSTRRVIPSLYIYATITKQRRFSSDTFELRKRYRARAAFRAKPLDLLRTREELSLAKSARSRPETIGNLVFARNWHPSVNEPFRYAARRHL